MAYHTPQNTRQYMRGLKMLHTTLLVGMIAFAVVVVVLMRSSIFEENITEIHTYMQFIVPVIAIASFLGSAIVFKKKVDEIRQSSIVSFRMRMDRYRAACITRWAMLEGAVMVALIAQLLTRNYYYSIFIFLLLIFFFLYAPSAEKIKSQLDLDSKEQAMLDDEYTDWT